jgi:hypothetical protein
MDSTLFSLCFLLVLLFNVVFIVIMMKRIYALSHRPSGFLSSPKWVLATMVTAFITKNAVSITFVLLAIGPGSGVIRKCSSQKPAAVTHKKRVI